MTFIDIHCHLDWYSDEDIEKIVQRAKKAGVGLILTDSVNPLIDKKLLELSGKYKGVKAALGSYPIDALNLSSKELEEQLDFIRKNKDKVAAIGEIGIDLKESPELEKQKKNFLKFIELAKELDKPVTVHSRKAEEECIKILEESGHRKVIMHCFNGNLKLVKRIIENGWSLSIPTNVTFSEHFQKVVQMCPIEQSFCETDSPFLHPVKGERNNEPANIIEGYKKIAEIKRITLKETEKKIEENYKRLFS